MPINYCLDEAYFIYIYVYFHLLDAHSTAIYLFRFVVCGNVAMRRTTSKGFRKSARQSFFCCGIMMKGCAIISWDDPLFVAQTH